MALLAGCQSQAQKEIYFEKGVALGVNKNHSLEEASGIVESVRNPGYLWAHNDSGNPPELFLLDGKTAKTKKVYRFAGISNRDWEDITLGIEDGVPYLYVGDIGDNLARYEFKYIYRTAEPALSDSTSITRFDTLRVKLEGGMRDTEALLLDPVSRSLFLVSKREHSVMLFEIRYPFAGDTLIAKNVGHLPVRNITAGAISPDGTEVLLKNYEHIYYWKKQGQQTIPDLLKSDPIKLAYEREPQGESIAWARDGSGFYTLGENAKGERSRLFFYKRK